MQPENLNPLRSYLNTTTSARCSFENPNWGLHRFLNSLLIIQIRLKTFYFKVLIAFPVSDFLLLFQPATSHCFLAQPILFPVWLCNQSDCYYL